MEIVLRCYIWLICYNNNRKLMHIVSDLSWVTFLHLNAAKETSKESFLISSQ